jgi:polyisoprenoid-binding protein YceI
VTARGALDGPPAVLLALLLVAIPSAAAGQHPVPDGAVREGSLSFDGHATLGDFTGTTTTVTGRLTGAADLAGARGWVEAPVNSLKTGNGKRDTDLNKSMESDRYTVMRFDLEDVSPEAVTADSATVTLHGTLLIHGVARRVDLPATLAFESPGIRLRSRFPLNLKDYQIGGLSKMLGMLKMYPDILVHVDLVFDPARP